MYFAVRGMSCAACSARVEKAVSCLEGVSSVSVNLLTNSMIVEGTFDADNVMEAVKKAGYQAVLQTQNPNSANEQSTKADALRDTQTPEMLKRLVASLIFLFLLMYLSMGHTMFGWPVPGILAENSLVNGFTQMLLSAIILVINQKFFVNGFRGVLHRAPNMDTLVGLGSAAAFGYSVFVLYKMSALVWEGGQGEAAHLLHDLYFESAAMILTLITVGKLLEARSKGKTTDAIRALMNLSPQTAVVRREGVEMQLPLADVRVGDTFLVYAGAVVPVDGIVVKGHAALDESALTGESVPVDKKEGDAVSQATINRSGYLECEAKRIGEDTTLSRIIQTVRETSASKAPIAKLADKVSGVFVPVVLALAFLTMVIWLLLGEDIGFAIARGISVLVISCPCALGLATPVAIMVGSGVGARAGILFKSAVSLEEMGRVKILALDKTGTITKGEPEVTDVVPFEKTTPNELLLYAYALEACSEHPLGKAVVTYAEMQKIEKKEISGYETLPGNGLMGHCDGQIIRGGSLSYMNSVVKISETFEALVTTYSKQGKTPLLFSKGNQVLGMIAVADVIKEDSAAAIKEAQKKGIKTVMLTGDNSITASAIAQLAGVDEVMADLLPQEKASAIRQLKHEGKVAMVGDGINDAPALVEADVGIAIGAGTDIAIDAADVVLMKNSLADAITALKIGRKTLGTVKMNLFWAFFYNCIGIPVAAGILVKPFGITLNPMIAAAAMSLSSFCVVMNALKLNMMRKHLSVAKKMTESEVCAECENVDNEKIKENVMMVKTMEIKGMMCGHCSGRVKNVLEELEQVDLAEVSHETGIAHITLNAEIDDAILSETVTKQGYEVVSLSR